MTLTVNGKEVVLTTETTITAYLEANQYRENRIVVELNEEILPKEQNATTYLKEGY